MRSIFSGSVAVSPESAWDVTLLSAVAASSDSRNVKDLQNTGVDLIDPWS